MATLDSLWRVRLIALASQIMKVAPAQISCAPGDLNANVAGTDDGVTFCGTSAIIDPYGAIVAAASVDREELIQAEISEDVIRSVRSRMAVFDHRRPELY